MAAAKKNGKWGYLDSIGNEAIPFMYDQVRPFSEKLAAVRIGSYWAYITPENKTLIRPLFINAESFKENRALFTIDDDSRIVKGFLNRSGRMVIVYEGLDEGLPFNEGLAIIYTTGLNRKSAVGFIDSNQITVIPPNYDDAFSFAYGHSVVSVGGLWGIINRYGIYSVTPRYTEAYSFSEKLAYTNSSGNVNFVDTNGIIKLSINKKIADKCGYFFNEGLCPVIKKGKVGFINTSGKLVITYKYYAKDSVSMPRFNDGFAAVGALKDNKLQFGYIDTKGKWIIKPEYDSANDFNFNRAVVSKNGKYGVINSSGKLVIPMQYDTILDYSETY